jgi:hypothetical protein
MAAITTSETIQAIQNGSVIRYLFRYELDNGEVHYARAWVANDVNEVDERARRGDLLLTSLARAEIDSLLAEQ